MDSEETPQSPNLLIVDSAVDTGTMLSPNLLRADSESMQQVPDLLKLDDSEEEGPKSPSQFLAQRHSEVRTDSG